MPEGENNITQIEREVKSLPIFIPKVNNPLSFRQLLKEITNGEFDLKTTTQKRSKYNLKNPLHMLI